MFKVLTSKLENPSDTYNAVLRRTYGLPLVANTAPAESDAKGWLVGGAFFPTGTEFRRKYKGRIYLARVEDGALVLDGRRFSTPSAATASITDNAVNGWAFWECRRPGQPTWIPIDRFRKA